MYSEKNKEFTENNPTLAIFQKFLKKLINKRSKVIISRETFDKHQAVISIKLFPSSSEKDNDNKIALKSSVTINIGDIVINNIIAVHTLLLDQPLAQKKQVVERHFNLFREALEDFYLDNQRYYLSQTYQPQHIVEKLPEEYINILNHFIIDSINLEFKEISLKQWIIKFSTTGFVKSEYTHQLAAAVFFQDNLSVGILQSLGEAKVRLDQNFKVQYKDKFELNLVSMMENAANKNLRLLFPETEKSPISVDKIWKDLRDEQFKQFRRISRVNSHLFWLNVVFPIILLIAAFMYFGASITMGIIAAVVVAKVVVVTNGIFKYDRIIKDEYKSLHRSHDNRTTMLEHICQEYKPKRTTFELPSNNSQNPEIISIYSFDHFIDKAENTNKTTNSHSKSKKQKPELTEERVVTRISSNAVAQHNSELPWRRIVDGQIYIPPAQCYEIGSTGYKNAPYGFFSKKAWQSIVVKLSNKKKQAISSDCASLFCAVNAKNDQGIVFFNKQERKKYDAHSKIKFKSKELGKLRIFGTVVAKGDKGRSLICYDVAKEPVHKKKSL